MSHAICFLSRRQASGVKSAGVPRPTAQAFTTGLAPLDALAPGGAFARGAVHEILTAPEHGAALFFATLLAGASAAPPGGTGDGEGTKAVAAATKLRHQGTGGRMEEGFREGSGFRVQTSAQKSPSSPSCRSLVAAATASVPSCLPPDPPSCLGASVPSCRRFICWCDPTREIYPPALASHGIALTHLFLLHPNGPRDLLWAISESLRCKGVAAVVAAPPRLSRVMARRLQLSAERGGGVGLLLRSTNAPGIDCYAAATRWLVRPQAGERTVQRWNVQLIHGHGGCIGQTVILEVSRENHSVRALESLANRPMEKSTGQTSGVAKAS